MLTIMISKVSKGVMIDIGSDDYDTAKRVYRSFLKASIKLDKCTKTVRQGPMANGSYGYSIHVPGLPYVVACDRLHKLWPEGETTSYPHPLIGG